jgi:uncharacterized membrane protein YccC
MSAIIVSQDRLNDTRSSIAARVAGTIIGAAISITIGALGARIDASSAIAMAASVAVAASVAYRFPSLRVAMWTCPIVLLTGEPSEPLLVVAAHRAAEVTLGAAIAWAFHWAGEKVLSPAGETPSPPP